MKTTNSLNRQSALPTSLAPKTHARTRRLLAFLLSVSLLAALFTSAQFQPGETISIDSKYFNDKREIKVFLPKGYQHAPNRRYKVVYLFDAQSSIFTDYVISSTNYLSSLSNTFISPYILVGIKTKN